MKQRLLISTVVVGMGLLGAILVYSFQHRDPLFHAKPESVWISQISYRDDSQIKVWRDFGPDGVRVLVRGLQKTDHPVERRYRQLYRTAIQWLPSPILRLLPNPRQDSTRSTRMCIVQVLARLGNDAAIATPAMVRALRDEATGVRQLAITFFTASEDENTVLSHMDKRAKSRVLPDFVRAMADSDWGLRNNAAIALGYYHEQREIVAPVLIKALHDPHNDVRLVAARSLNRVAPDAAADAGVVQMLVEVLKDPNDQIAYRAAELLGDFGKEPELAVPALMAGVQGTNVLVAATAARSLGRFGGEARAAIPVLQEATKADHGAVRREATNALKRIDSAPAAQAGRK
jgi:HEAT repeat protein